MKKSSLLVFIFLFLVPLSTVAAEPITVKIDGIVQTYDQPPVNNKGSVMVPLRGIFEALGAEIHVDGKNIEAVRGDTVVNLTIGEDVARVNGDTVKLAQKSFVTNGRTLVPVRFVSEALGADVEWISEERIVSILSNGYYSFPIEYMDKIEPLNEELYHGQALVTLSYDDGYRNWYYEVLPLHSKYNMPGTFNIIGEMVYAEDENYLNSSQVWVAHDLGIEIASHTQTHPFLTDKTDSEIREEFETSKFILEDLVEEVSTLAIPYSSYNDEIRDIAMEYFDGVRVYSHDTNRVDNYDPYWLKSFAVVNTMEFATIQAWIDQAIEEKSWVIIMLHSITEERLEEYETTPEILEQIMQYITEQGKDTILPVNTKEGLQLYQS